MHDVERGDVVGGAGNAVRAGVGDVPFELLGRDDVVEGVGGHTGRILHRVPRGLADQGQRQDGDEGNGGPDDLRLRRPVDVGGLVSFAPPVADDEVDQKHLGDYEDDPRDPQNHVVEEIDVRPKGGKTLGEQPAHVDVLLLAAGDGAGRTGYPARVRRRHPRGGAGPPSVPRV
jgi:hypothetical protein